MWNEKDRNGETTEGMYVMDGKKRKRKHILTIVMVFLVGMFSVSLIGVVHLSSLSIETGVTEAVAAGNSHMPMIPTSFADLSEELKPCVVNISTTKKVSAPSMGSFRGSPFEDFFGDEFFRRYFGNRPERQYKQKSLGSGFIISGDGFIFTNYHVIEKADEILVKLADGQEYKAEVKGTDENTDIALLKIDPKEELPVADLGSSSKLRVGEWVIAIGNPFGLSQTVTVGIVSAKGRVIGAGPYDDFIQTDASINPGNSGGPLFNLTGEVVGINTAIVAQGQGIGFAIPVDMAKEILPSLKTRGKVLRGWLGVSVQDITDEIADSLNLKTKKGALVGDVFPGDPADKAGIKTGDVIVDIGGEKIVDTHDLLRVVAGLTIGKEAEVTILRNGEMRKVAVTVVARDEGKQKVAEGEESEYYGMTVQAITAEIAEHLGLEEKNGVIVTEVKAASPADESGIRPQDIIIQVNRTTIENLAEYREAMEKIGESRSVLLLIQRGGTKYFVVIRGKE